MQGTKGATTSPEEYVGGALRGPTPNKNSNHSSGREVFPGWGFSQLKKNGGGGGGLNLKVGFFTVVFFNGGGW